MALIDVQNLSRSFRVHRKEPGFTGALRGLIRRQYETVAAVRDMTFQIEEGELVGFLGPNGAGKTTTLKMLSGLLHPTAGSARVLGHVPWERHDAYRRQFALLLGQKNQLWWDLPARDSLELNGRIYGIDPSTVDRRVAELADLLQVRDKLTTAVRELSLGERMKCELIAALLHQPRVLFLDEPTIGLDVVSQQTVREFLRHYNQTRRTTIILTSHYMEDIQQLCGRVLVIDHGTLFFDGRLDTILDRFADYKIVTVHLDATTAGPAGVPDPAATAAATAPSGFERYGELIEAGAARVRLKVKRHQVIRTCKALLDELPIRDLDIEEVPIEEVIRDLFRGRG